MLLVGAGLKALKIAVRRCTRGSPAEPCEEVQSLLKAYGMTALHLLTMYEAFREVRCTDDLPDRGYVEDVSEVEKEDVRKLVSSREEWVVRILDRLLSLGGCVEKVSWDRFLWILLRFCSLNRVELAQCLFVIIQEETQSPSKHYVTGARMQEFYEFYNDCPVKSFRTQFFDFDNLPLARYYVADFTELTQRYAQLINPIVHLQKEIRKKLPSWDFWEEADQTQAFSRKVTYDFFLMKSGRVHLRGDPPFRESCDMLVPDALGGVPINSEHWIRRTARDSHPQGLRQLSVWGEQPLPETVELLQQALEEAAAAEQARKKALAAAKAAAAKDGSLVPSGPETEETTVVSADALVASAAGGRASAGKQATSGIVAAGPRPGAAPEPAQASPVVAWSEAPRARADGGAHHVSPVLPLTAPGGPSPAAIARGAVVPQRGPGPASDHLPPRPIPHPSVLSTYAATLDEGDAGPPDVPPPPWMRSCTTVPAPVRDTGPPRPRMLGRQTWQAHDDDGNIDANGTIARSSTAATSRNDTRAPVRKGVTFEG